MQLTQLPSVDVFIGLFFLLGTAYAFILQREKTITTLCSVYIGLVVATQFSESLFKFFNGNAFLMNQIWVKSNISNSTIAIGLFFLTIIMVSASINSKSKRSDEISIIEVLIYSGLMVALILSSVLDFLPETLRNHYIEVSVAAKYLNNFGTFFVVLPPLMFVLLGRKKKERSYNR
jgi:hypothetical protein